MPLDMTSRVMLRMIDRMSGKGRVPGTADIPHIRAATDRQLLPRGIGRLGLASVSERNIPGPAGMLAIRVYRPRGDALGIVLFLHGGGFVHCGLESHDAICAALARSSRCVVVALAYRLAPEHRFPAATEDAYATLLWLAANARDIGAPAGRIAVSGDSAGANLACVMTLLARDKGGPPIGFQLLFYPPTVGVAEVASRAAYGEGYFLTTAFMAWYLAQYIDAEHHTLSPYFAPALAPDHRGLPPAMIVTAEYDPLRDEGSIYAEKLRGAGVPVSYSCAPGTIHAFLNFYPVYAGARRALRDGGRAIRETFSAAPATDAIRP